MQMKPKKKTGQVFRLHWAAHLTIRYGTVLSLLLLMAAFFFPKASFYAISLCQTPVYSFAVSVIGGLMLDVISKRTGHQDS